MSPNYHAVSTMLRACEQRWRNRPRRVSGTSPTTGALLLCLSAAFVAALVVVACGATA